MLCTWRHDDLARRIFFLFFYVWECERLMFKTLEFPRSSLPEDRNKRKEQRWRSERCNPVKNNPFYSPWWILQTHLFHRAVVLRPNSDWLRWWCLLLICWKSITISFISIHRCDIRPSPQTASSSSLLLINQEPASQVISVAVTGGQSTLNRLPGGPILPSHSINQQMFGTKMALTHKRSHPAVFKVIDPFMGCYLANNYGLQLLFKEANETKWHLYLF